MEPIADFMGVSSPFPTGGFYRGDLIVEQYKDALLIQSQGAFQLLYPEKGQRTPVIVGLTSPPWPPTGKVSYVPLFNESRRLIDERLTAELQLLAGAPSPFCWPAMFIKGVAINALMFDMQRTNWYKAAEDRRKGPPDADPINKLLADLARICEEPIGFRVAGELWSAFVPKNCRLAPRFLIDAENPRQIPAADKTTQENTPGYGLFNTSSAHLYRPFRAHPIPFIDYGFQKGDVIVEEYQGALIVENTDDICIVEPGEGRRSVVDTVAHREKQQAYAGYQMTPPLHFLDQVDCAKQYIDTGLSASHDINLQNNSMLVIGGVQVAELQSDMLNLGFFYDYPRAGYIWESASEDKILPIKEGLRRLTADPYGFFIANHFWKKYGPGDLVEKPAYLSDQSALARWDDDQQRPSRLTIKGVEMEGLRHAMRDMQWHISPYALYGKGATKIRIADDMRRISGDPIGLSIARYFWEAYIPPDYYQQPHYLRDENGDAAGQAIRPMPGPTPTTPDPAASWQHEFASIEQKAPETGDQRQLRP